MYRPGLRSFQQRASAQPARAGSSYMHTQASNASRNNNGGAQRSGFRRNPPLNPPRPRRRAVPASGVPVFQPPQGSEMVYRTSTGQAQGSQPGQMAGQPTGISPDYRQRLQAALAPWSAQGNPYLNSAGNRQVSQAGYSQDRGSGFLGTPRD